MDITIIDAISFEKISKCKLSCYFRTTLFNRFYYISAIVLKLFIGDIVSFRTTLEIKYLHKVIIFEQRGRVQ